ncbi:MAG TPA: hypothetical protein VF604_20180 [Pyrinomonadaceae bacterium]|jgi:hypothetical protein
MKSKIVYVGGKSFGVVNSKNFYVAQVQSSNEGIELQFEFPIPAFGIGENSKIESTSLNLTREEAEEIAAVLQSYLHHPKIQNQPFKWVTFREMPLIEEKEILEKLIWKWQWGGVPISVENSSDLHIASVTCIVVYTKPITIDNEIISNEKREEKFRVQLNISPSESKHITFNGLPKGINISSITVLQGNGYKIKSE